MSSRTYINLRTYICHHSSKARVDNDESKKSINGAINVSEKLVTEKIDVHVNVSENTP